MFLPETIIIDLSKVNFIKNNINSVLKKVSKLINSSQSVDTGNDLSYASKQLNLFKKKLINLIIDESKNYESDIFGNKIKPIKKYKYAELVFSQDYKEIQSLRLLGKNDKGIYSRYALFNLENIFDPTTIVLLNNFKEIIADSKSIDETNYNEFIKKYFFPFPIVYSPKRKNSEQIKNVSKKFNSGKEKTFEEFLKQTQLFNSIDFKSEIYEARVNGFTQVDSLSFILSEIDEIIQKIETAEIEDDPKEIINIVQKYFLDKYKIKDIMSFISDNLNLGFEIPEIDIPRFKLPNFNFDINDLFGDFSKEVDLLITTSLSNVLSAITKNLLNLLNESNKIDDFFLENIFPLPEASKENKSATKYESAFNEEWTKYIEYAYFLLLEADKLTTQPRINKLPDNFMNNIAIKNKISLRKNKLSEELCAELPSIKNKNITKTKLRNKKIKNIQDAVNAFDVDSLMEKIKYYDFCKDYTYFKTESSNDDIVLDILKFISNSLRDKPNSSKPKLPASSSEMSKLTSDMVEQIEGILEKDEINSLLNGTYSEETAEIVKNIAKINFSNLTHKVDPIKYFRMLGKVIGSKGSMRVLSTRNVGIKK